MKKFFILILLFSIQAFALEYPPLTPEQNATYEKQLQDSISKAEKNVQELQYNATRRDMAPMWNNKLELQNGIIQLEVKKTLVSNFKGTESLLSPKVRERLLSILNQSNITTSDLAELQTLVLEEKARIRAEKTQQDRKKLEAQPKI